MTSRIAFASGGALIVALAFAPVTATAYVDVELKSHRHVIGTSYTAEGDKLVVYSRSGAVEIDRRTVRAVREQAGDPPGEQRAPKAAKAPDGGAKNVAASAGRTEDPQALERELGSRLLAMRIDRLAAEQRGDSDSMKKLEHDIAKTQRERTANWNVLHPEDAATN